MPMLRRLLNSITEIIYPATCTVCKNRLKNKPSIAGFICTNCWGKAKKNLPPFCYSCGRQLAANNFTKGICPHCVKNRLHFDRAFSPCAYEGVIKKLIHEFKYNNKDYLGLSLSKLMIDFIKEYNLPMDLIDFVIPIPLHTTRLRQREFNQAQILSNHIASEFNKNVLSDGLKRIRNTKTQTELEETKRFLNIQGSFLLNENQDVKNKNILLVDDVLTTGATASEAARVLKNGGANIVFVLTLAN
jgi:ComF family protein